MLEIPDDVAVAARDRRSLESCGREIVKIPRIDVGKAVVIRPVERDEPASVWAHRDYDGYRGAWQSAARANLVDPLAEWGDGVDVDHLYPRSWARIPGMELEWLRLYPVWAEVNREAGRSHEKLKAQQWRSRPEKRNAVVYAREIAFMKILGHPIGTLRKPERLFGSASSRAR